MGSGPRYVRIGNRRQFLVLTDGACLNNGQADPRAGWACVVSDTLTLSARLEARGPSGAACPQTSNRAELRAAIAAIGVWLVIRSLMRASRGGYIFSAVLMPALLLLCWGYVPVWQLLLWFAFGAVTTASRLWLERVYITRYAGRSARTQERFIRRHRYLWNASALSWGLATTLFFSLALASTGAHAAGAEHGKSGSQVAAELQEAKLTGQYTFGEMDYPAALPRTSGLTEQEASDLIMRARAHWFDEE